MREVKFRVWSDFEGLMSDDVTLFANGWLSVFWPNGYEAKYMPDSGLKLMQYTGLKDKNGMEIYEGDVVLRDYEVGHTIHDPIGLGVVDYEIEKQGRYIGVVNYRPSAGFILNSCRHYTIDGSFIENLSGIKIYPDYSKVIGNIYENPELLVADVHVN